MSHPGSPEQHHRLLRAVEGERLPAAVIDLEALDQNIRTLTEPLKGQGKKLRIATKSVRCLEVIRRIQSQAPEVVQGLMAYTVEEAAFLADQGFSDLLVAYPTIQVSDADLAAKTNREGKAHLRVVVDEEVQVQSLGTRAVELGATIPLVVEVDASLRPASLAHIGVRRSPIRDPEDAVRLARFIERTEGVRFEGLMVYEAHIAGLGDHSDFKSLLNPAKKILRRVSRGPLEKLRKDLHRAFSQAGISIPVFNGGGTGSLNWANQEVPLTELTAGSGFLASHLFDYYEHLKLEPAALFALQVVRHPSPGYATCLGGGLVASGEAGQDRLPRPFYPPGLKLVDLEGAGEVQTPLVLPKGTWLELGDPVFFRHAKAGELAEHFNEYLLCRNGAIESRVPTYRGQGKAFL